MAYTSTEYTSTEVITKIRQLKLSYIQNQVGADPSALPHHFQEFLGYASLLYEHYATVLKQYREAQAKVIKEENDARIAVNQQAEKPSDRLTVTEMEQRVTIRLAELRAQRDYLEIEVKGATIHINGCQSIMKNWGDEAKGIR